MTMTPNLTPFIQIVSGVHPYWCNDCGENAGFTIPGCPINHRKNCPRFGENAQQVFNAAVTYVKATGRKIS